MGDENLGYMAGNGWVTDVTDGVLVVGMCVGGDAIALYRYGVGVKHSGDMLLEKPWV